MGSCDGLVLLCTDGGWYFDHPVYVLANPSTRESKAFPLSPYYLGKYIDSGGIAGFGYNSLRDDYQILMAFTGHSQKCCYVYSLRKNIWQMTQNVSGSGLTGKSTHSWGVFINGALHWLYFAEEEPVYRSIFIVSYRFSEEEFCWTAESFQLSSILVDGAFDVFNSTLGVVSGCLGLLVRAGRHASDGWHVDLWILKEYGVKDSWTKIRVSYSGEGSKYFRWNVWWKNKLFDLCGRDLFVFDFVKQKTKTYKNAVLSICEYDKPLVQVYVESLISPCRNNWILDD